MGEQQISVLKSDDAEGDNEPSSVTASTYKMRWSSSLKDWVIENANGETLYRCRGNDEKAPLPHVDQTRAWTAQVYPTRVAKHQEFLVVSGAGEDADGHYIRSKEMRYNRNVWLKMGRRANNQ